MGKHHFLAVAPVNPNPDEIWSKKQAAAAAGVSVRTWERHEAEGTAPPRIRLSERRIGYWRSDVREWLRSRTAIQKAA